MNDGRHTGRDARLSILITNICMAGRSGTEVMTAELALALVRRGHTVTIYAPRIGAFATGLMSRGVPVVDRIADIGETPDIIHGHHNTTLAVALARFPSIPALFICHDTATDSDAPILSNRIGAFVGVDPAAARRLLVEGADPQRIHVIPNAVDLSLFPVRTTWRTVPTRALAITKSRAPWLQTVREACTRAGLPLTEVGPAVHRVVDDLPAAIVAHDVVFAWSRSACEAAATGAAVILCDEVGFGGLLTAGEAERFPDSALGRRLLAGTIDADQVADALGRYDPEDAAAVAVIVRRKLSLDDMVDGYERLYHEILARHHDRSGDQTEVDRGFAVFLEHVLPRHDLPPDRVVQGDALRSRLLRLDAWLGSPATGGAPRDGAPPTDAQAGIAFGERSVGCVMLGAGWSTPENWGVWSESETAVLDLPYSLVLAWNGVLAFECRHYRSAAVSPDEARAVEILLGMRLVGCWHFQEDTADDGAVTTKAVTVPMSLVREIDAPTVPLRFRFLNAVSPLESGESADPRLLGLALFAVRPGAALSSIRYR